MFLFVVHIGEEISRALPVERLVRRLADQYRVRAANDAGGGKRTKIPAIQAVVAVVQKKDFGVADGLAALPVG